MYEGRSIIDIYGRIHPALFDINILYILLNPLEEIDGWILQDIVAAQEHHTPRTDSMIGIKTDW